jgi:hypothetical protein
MLEQQSPCNSPILGVPLSPTKKALTRHTCGRLLYLGPCKGTAFLREIQQRRDVSHNNNNNNNNSLVNERQYEQVPKLVETSHGSKAVILRNQQRQTDSTIINNNKSYILISANEEETCMLIDVAMLRQECDQERSREDYKI